MGLFNYWTVRGATSDLIDRRVDVHQPVLTEKLGGAEADTSGSGTVVHDFVDRMTRGGRLLRSHTVKNLHVVAGRQRQGRSGEHHECLGTAWKGCIDCYVTHRALRAANKLARVDPKNQRQFFRDDPRGEHLSDRSR